jgi:hypothetical protein
MLKYWVVWVSYEYLLLREYMTYGELARVKVVTGWQETNIKLQAKTNYFCSSNFYYTVYIVEFEMKGDIEKLLDIA